MTVDLGTIGLILAILFHTGALFYWAGQLRKAVTTLEKLVTDHEERIRELERAA